MGTFCNSKDVKWFFFSGIVYVLDWHAQARVNIVRIDNKVRVRDPRA